MGKKEKAPKYKVVTEKRNECPFHGPIILKESVVLEKPDDKGVRKETRQLVCSKCFAVAVEREVSRLVPE